MKAVYEFTSVKKDFTQKLAFWAQISTLETIKNFCPPVKKFYFLKQVSLWIKRLLT